MEVFKVFLVFLRLCLCLYYCLFSLPITLITCISVWGTISPKHCRDDPVMTAQNNMQGKVVKMLNWYICSIYFSISGKLPLTPSPLDWAICLWMRRQWYAQEKWNFSSVFNNFSCLRNCPDWSIESSWNSLKGLSCTNRREINVGARGSSPLTQTQISFFQWENLYFDA